MCEAFHKRQVDAQASLGPLLVLADLGEEIEHAFGFLGRNADPVVRDLHDGMQWQPKVSLMRSRC